MEELRADRIEVGPPVEPGDRCVELDRIEAAITRRLSLRLRVRGAVELREVLPIDLLTVPGRDLLEYRDREGGSGTIDLAELEAVEVLEEQSS